MIITQAEFDAAYKAARDAITAQNAFYSHMISDEMLESIIAPAVRAAINARPAAHILPKGN